MLISYCLLGIVVSILYHLHKVDFIFDMEMKSLFDNLFDFTIIKKIIIIYAESHVHCTLLKSCQESKN